MCSQLSNDDLRTKNLTLYHTRKNIVQTDETLILKHKFKTSNTIDEIIKIYNKDFYEFIPLKESKKSDLKKLIDNILDYTSPKNYDHYYDRSKEHRIDNKSMLEYIPIYNIDEYRNYYNNNWKLVDKRVTIKSIKKSNNNYLYSILSVDTKTFITNYFGKDKNNKLTMNEIKSPQKIINKLSNYIRYLLGMHNSLSSKQIYILNNNKKYNLPDNIKKEFNPIINDTIYYKPDTQPNIKELVAINLECSFLNSMYFNNYYHIDNYTYKGIIFSSCIGINYKFNYNLFQILMLLIVDLSNESQQILDNLKSKINHENISSNDIPIIIIARKSKCPLNYYNFKIIETTYSCQSIPEKIKNLCLIENFSNRYLVKIK